MYDSTLPSYPGHVWGLTRNAPDMPQMSRLDRSFLPSIRYAQVQARVKRVGEVLPFGNWSLDAALASGGSGRPRKQEQADADLAVRHPDGYLEIRDQSKTIVSGGENIASVEVERVLDSELCGKS